jgi:mono/diheme cytochrome c family protein
MLQFTRTKGLITALVFASGVALAQEAASFDFGKHEYDAKCASCHGETGKGDGANKPYLSKSPSDLTTLSKKNQGEFPYEHVYEVIDGRQVVEEQAPRDMPCWAAEYLVEESGDYQDVPYNPERYVETRLVALVTHVRSLQEK